MAGSSRSCKTTRGSKTRSASTTSRRTERESWLYVFVPVGCLTLGSLLDQPLRSLHPLRAILLGLAAATCTGFGIGVLTSIVWAGYLSVGPIEGAATGLVFAPAFLVIAFRSRRVGQARPGSVLDAMDRRSVWATVAGCVAIGGLASIPDWDPKATVQGHSSPEASLLAVTVAVAGLVALFAFDVLALLLVRRSIGRVRHMRPRNPESPQFGGRQLDLGVGDEVWEDAVLAPLPYRGSDRVREVFFGSPELAIGPARRAAARMLFLVSAASLAVTAALLLYTSSPKPALLS